jgi:hypothetical protein
MRALLGRRAYSTKVEDVKNLCKQRQQRKKRNEKKKNKKKKKKVLNLTDPCVYSQLAPS